MAIDPESISTLRVGQLPPFAFTLASKIAHEIGTDLNYGTVEQLAETIAAYIGATDSIAFNPVTVLDGQTLPDTTVTEWILVGKGTFTNVNGGANLTTTEELNALISNGTTWSIGVEIPITVDPVLIGISQTVNAGVTNYSPSEDAVRTAIDEKVFLNAVGSFHYSDEATQTVPLTIVADVPKKLTNDTLGDYTVTSNAPYGVSSVWNSVDNELDFSEMTIGDLLTLRVDAEITTGSANQTLKCYVKLGVGSASEFDLLLSQGQVKAAGAYPFVSEVSLDLAYQNIIDNPGEIYVLSDGGATIKINGWYIEILRKNINIVDITTDLGYIPEDVANKQNNLTPDGTGVKYPSVDAVNTGLATKQDALTNPVTGTGTTNYLPKFTGTSTVENSLISDNGTNIGIGITTQKSKIQIGSFYDNMINLDKNLIGNNVYFDGLDYKRVLGSYVSQIDFFNGEINLKNGDWGVADSIIEYKNTVKIAYSGNVSINTTNDNGVDKLQVLGSIKTTSSAQVGDNVTAASATNVGAIRYRTSGNNSYAEMCMQTGASTYVWTTIVENNW